MSKRKRDENTTDDDWRVEMNRFASVQKQYQYMLDNYIFTDCTFVVGPEDGETREFKAHRVFIARVSPVFEATLLRGEMEVKPGHVRVTDVSLHTFQLLLNSIYGIKEPEMTTFQETQDLAFAANKYQMTALLESCVTRMGKMTTSGNIWVVLETTNLLQNERLKEMCVQVLRFNTLRCITDPGFLQASEKNVTLLLEQDELNMEDEILLVNITVHWARHAARQRGLSDDDSGVRAVLKPRLLSLFHFLAMSPQQFMLGPGLASWLTSDEISDITECLQFKVARKMPQHLSSVTQKRKHVTLGKVIAAGSEIQGLPELFVCKREIIGYRPDVPQTYKNPFCSECSDPLDHKYVHHKYLHATLIFRAKANCNWWGFQCASQCRNNPMIDVVARSQREWYKEEKLNVLVQTCKDTSSDSFQGSKIYSEIYYDLSVDYDSTIRFLFNEPIPLIPENWYKLHVVFRYTSMYQQEKDCTYPNPCRAQIVPTETGVEFEFDTKKDEKDCSEYDGIIESLIFSL